MKTQREKLVKLLDDAKSEWVVANIKASSEAESAFVEENELQMIVDYLLRKGVAKVTRCENCSHYHSGIKLCKLFQIYYTPDHFCSEGEPKEGTE